MIPSDPRLPQPGQDGFEGKLYYQLTSLLRTIAQEVNGLITLWSPVGATVQSKTASYTVQEIDGLVLIDTTAGNVTVTLPDVKYKGNRYTVKRVTAGANTLTIQGASGNVDGAGSTTIATQYQAKTFVSDGTNWWTV